MGLKTSILFPCIKKQDHETTPSCTGGDLPFIPEDGVVSIDKLQIRENNTSREIYYARYYRESPERKCAVGSVSLHFPSVHDTCQQTAQNLTDKDWSSTLRQTREQPIRNCFQSFREGLSSNQSSTLCNPNEERVEVSRCPKVPPRPQPPIPPRKFESIHHGNFEYQERNFSPGFDTRDHAGDIRQEKFQVSAFSSGQNKPKISVNSADFQKRKIDNPPKMPPRKYEKTSSTENVSATSPSVIRNSISRVPPPVPPRSFERKARQHTSNTIRK